jgi:hypothetical protein
MQDNNPPGGDPGGPGPTQTPPPAPGPRPGGGPAWASHGVVQRAIALLTQPADEWARIDGEPTSVGRLFTGYALILALIPPLAVLIAMLLDGYPMELVLRIFLPMMLVYYLVNLAIVYALGLGIDALAPSMGGTRSSVQAMKLAVYSWTPLWVLGLLFLLSAVVVTDLSRLWLIAGFAWGAFLMWLGLPRLMRVSADKAPAYVGAAVALWAVLILAAHYLAQAINNEIVASAIYPAYGV